MVVAALLLGLGLTGPALLSPDNTSNTSKSGGDYLNEAMAAYQKKEYPAYLENLTRAYRAMPGSVTLMYYLSSAHALNGNPEQALDWLKKVAAGGLYFPVEGDPDFDILKDNPQFKTLLKQLAANTKPVKNSETAFTIPEKDLVPEGITYNPRNKTFYITSIYKRKIISIDCTGKIEDFIAEKQDNFWGGVGIRVDIPRQVLWANNRVGNHIKDFQTETPGLAGISKYQIAGKKLLKKYVVADGKPHLLNDLINHPDGTVYITDSETGAIYTISQMKDQLEIYIEPGHFVYPNGITMSDDHAYLFVAHLEGISRVRIEDKSIHPLTHPEHVVLCGIDGLYFYRGGLVAVQNDSGLNRAVRFFLNKNLDRVEKVSILDSHHPLYNIPTTGVIVGDDFYYIANSQMGNFTPDNTLYPLDKLEEVIILKNRLTH